MTRKAGVIEIFVYLIWPLLCFVDHLVAAFNKVVLRDTCGYPWVGSLVNHTYSADLSIKADNRKAQITIAWASMEQITPLRLVVCIAVANKESQTAFSGGAWDSQLFSQLLIDQGVVAVKRLGKCEVKTARSLAVLNINSVERMGFRIGARRCGWSPIS